MAWRRCTPSVSRSTKSPWCTRSGMSISSPSSGYAVPVSALGTTVRFDGADPDTSAIVGRRITVVAAPEPAATVPTDECPNVYWQGATRRW